MSSRGKSPLASLLFIAMATLAGQACRGDRSPAGSAYAGPAGEPDQYSATVARIVDDGAEREVSISRQFRSGEMRRQEWIERGRNRALIWRPDLGKAFLLDLDARTYIEIEIPPTGKQPDTRTPRDGARDQRPGQAPLEESALEAIDRTMDEPSPDRIDTHALPGAVIQGHPCSAYEQRASFPDGHTEVTKTFRAQDLSGLVLRIETLSEPGATRVVTELRDLRNDVPAAAFIVPPDYKKVDMTR